MISQDLQEIHHLQSCMDDLITARALFEKVREQLDNPLCSATFKFAIIVYARPFKESRIPKEAFSDKFVKRKLTDEVIPANFVSLHKEMISLRDGFLAHSDMTFIDSKLLVSEINGKAFPMRVSNVLHGTELMNDVDKIICLIGHIIDWVILRSESMTFSLDVGAAA